MKQIFIPLLDEGTPCWRPIKANPLGENLYLIPENTKVPDDESWKFKPGSVVQCVNKELAEGVSLVAERELEK